MNTATVKILGAEHLLCLSTRAKLDMEEQFGSVDAAFERLASEDKRTALETTFSLLDIMMRAGAKYAEKTGLMTAPPIAAEDMMDLIGASDLPDLVMSLRMAIINGARREVEVDIPKNAQATPPKP